MEHFCEAARAKHATHATRRRLIRAQIKAIAKAYDGQSETTEELVERFELCRHQVIRAAKRNGYGSNKSRKRWTPGEDQFLHEHWRRVNVEVIAQKLGRSIQSITLRKERLGINFHVLDDWAILRLQDSESGCRRSRLRSQGIAVRTNALDERLRTGILEFRFPHQFIGAIHDQRNRNGQRRNRESADHPRARCDQTSHCR
jgi:hypothetical protein